MVWKPKEKELTLEEAVAQAKKELSPLWLGSEPLVAAIRDSSGKTSVFPLSQAFSDIPRVFLFIDPTQPSSDFLLQYGREWGRRYQTLGCGFITVLRLPYAVAPEAPEFQSFARKSGLGFPVVLDRDGLLAEALSASKVPAVVLVHAANTVFSATEWAEPEAVELKLQEYLRRKDPGLPLRPPFKRDIQAPRSVLSIELGQGRGHKFPEPGFQPDPNGFHTALFEGPLQPDRLSPGALGFQGAWSQDQDRIVTSDSSAAIVFHSPRANIALVAQCVSKIGGGGGKVIVELDGRPAFEVFAGTSLHMDEDGNSRAQIESLQLYNVLKGLAPGPRVVCLRFPSAKEFPIALHGLRLWD